MWCENMNEVLMNRVPVLPYIVKTDSSTKAEIINCKEASSLIMQASIMNAQGRSRQAIEAVDFALKLMPGDTTAKMIRQETASNVVASFVQEARSARNLG